MCRQTQTLGNMHDTTTLTTTTTTLSAAARGAGAASAARKGASFRDILPWAWTHYHVVDYLRSLEWCPEPVIQGCEAQRIDGRMLEKLATPNAQLLGHLLPESPVLQQHLSGEVADVFNDAKRMLSNGVYEMWFSGAKMRKNSRILPREEDAGVAYSLDGVDWYL